MLIREAFRFGRVQYSPGATLGPRDTFGYEFVRILKGQVRWTYDGQTHDIEPGMFILSQPGHREHYRWDPATPTQHDFIHFHLHDDLPPWLPAPDAWPLIQAVPGHDILHAHFQYLVDLSRSGHPLMMNLITLTLNQMLHAWVLDLHNFKDQGFRDFSLPVQKVLDLVMQAWQEQRFRPPSMEQMAARSGVSRSSFIRIFKEQCGDSPTRFFERQRLHLAKLYLQQTDRLVEEIADRLQYPNPFHFSRSFKHRFGLAPRDYRAAGLDAPSPPTSYLFQRLFSKLSGTQQV
jgi:AraC-like DNA-binding protein